MVKPMVFLPPTPPPPRSAKLKATALKQDVYFLGCHWIPAVCFPPAITTTQIHSKGKQWAFCHS